MNSTARRRALHWAAWAGGAAVLALVFSSWLRPDMMFAVLTAAWGCL
ncbi:MAG TPA: hypothetical protein VH328_00025 [Burkholderiaceae bacterium]|nr:hypothetical protein [Burkholderiaceae bacterium]